MGGGRGGYGVLGLIGRGFKEVKDAHVQEALLYQLTWYSINKRGYSQTTYNSESPFAFSCSQSRICFVFHPSLGYPKTGFSSVGLKYGITVKNLP